MLRSGRKPQANLPQNTKNINVVACVSAHGIDYQLDSTSTGDRSKESLYGGGGFIFDQVLQSTMKPLDHKREVWIEWEQSGHRLMHVASCLDAGDLCYLNELL